MNADDVKLLDVMYGVCFESRLRKLKEECGELIEAIGNYSSGGNVEDVEDEMRDVLAVIVHTAHIRGKSVEELFDMAMDKVKGRISNPDYKRKHPHKNQVFDIDEKECRERDIGEVFEWKGKRYRVCADDDVDMTCGNCPFAGDGEACTFAGECMSMDREDGRHVKFVEVG